MQKDGGCWVKNSESCTPEQALIVAVCRPSSPDHGERPGEDDSVAEGEKKGHNREEDHDDRSPNGAVKHPERAEKEGKDQRESDALGVRDNDGLRRRILTHKRLRVEIIIAGFSPIFRSARHVRVYMASFNPIRISHQFMG